MGPSTCPGRGWPPFTHTTRGHLHGYHTTRGSSPWLPTRLAIRPSSNKKSFPVHRPGGLKRAYWNFFFPILKKILIFLLFHPVHSSLLKMKLGKNSRPPDWLFFRPPGSQETIFLLKGGLIFVSSHQPFPLYMAANQSNF